MPPVQVLLVCAAIGAGVLVGQKVVHVVKKVDHKVCHIVTFGKKCKAGPPKQQN